MAKSSPSLTPREGQRRVIFSGHPKDYEGYFIEWQKDAMGRLMAAIELEDGQVRIERTIEHLRFTDKYPE